MGISPDDILEGINGQPHASQDMNQVYGALKNDTSFDVTLMLGGQAVTLHYEIEMSGRGRCGAGKQVVPDIFLRSFLPTAPAVSAKAGSPRRPERIRAGSRSKIAQAAPLPAASPAAAGRPRRGAAAHPHHLFDLPTHGRSGPDAVRYHRAAGYGQVRE